MNVKLLAVKSLTRKSEGESRRLYVTATLCSKLPITSTGHLTASSPAWGGEDLYNDISLPSTYSEDPFLRLKVMNEKTNFRKECVGEVEISLKDLTNLRTDKWFKLKSAGSEDVGEIRLILQKGAVLKKTNNDDSEEGEVVDGKEKHLSKKFGVGDEIVREGGVTYVKLGTFFAEAAEFAFHSDDRYGILRAPFVVRTLGRTLSRTLSKRFSSEESSSRRPSVTPSTHTPSPPPFKMSVSKEPQHPPPAVAKISHQKPKRATNIPTGPHGSAPLSPSPVLLNIASRQPGYSDSGVDPRMALLVRFLGKLAVDKGAMHDMLRTLPEDVRLFVDSRDFTEGCQRKFAALCQPGQRSIPIESVCSLSFSILTLLLFFIIFFVVVSETSCV